MNKCVCLTVLIAGAMVAHARAASLPAACGSDSVHYKVKGHRKAPLPPVLQDGKSHIIFVESLNGGFMSSPVVRYAVDGNWVGANKGDSYLAVDVTPGNHTLCASRQSSVKMEKDNVGTAQLQVEPGKTYVYTFTLVREEGAATVPMGGAPGSDMTVRHSDLPDTSSFAETDTEMSQLQKLSQSDFVAK